MRIIGGRDYYDSGMAWGRDDAVIFLRGGDRRLTERQMHEEMGLPDATCGARFVSGDESRYGWRRPGHHALTSCAIRREGRTTRFEVAHAQVILCGTLHNGVHIETTEPYGVARLLDARWIWTAQALRDFAADNGLKLNEGRNSTETGYGMTRTRGAISFEAQDLETWFTPRALVPEGLITAKVTVASMNPLERHPQNDAREDLSWRIDQGTLADMEFAKAVDPYTAFQEISMWKGGVLPADGPPMVEITDDRVKIAKHGFDHPLSFRKAKTGS